MCHSPWSTLSSDHRQRQRGWNGEAWNNGTYWLENALSYALERAWCVAICPNASNAAVGSDEGVGEDPLLSSLHDLHCLLSSLAAMNPHSAWTDLESTFTLTTPKSRPQTPSLRKMTPLQRSDGSLCPCAS